jgi:hypothetical protein
MGFALGSCPPATAALPAEEAAARQDVLARLHDLASIDLEYSVKREDTPAGALPPSWNVQLPAGGVGAFRVKQGEERTDHRFSYLEGMSRWELTRTPNPALKEEVLRTIQTYRPGIVEQLFVRATSNSGRVSPTGSLPMSQWIGLALGLRNSDDAGEGDWLNADAINAMVYARNKTGLIVLSWVSPHGNRHEFDFDPARGNALVHYRMVATGSDTVVTEVTAADFRLVNGVRIPYQMIGTITNLKAKKVIVRWEANVTRCDVRGKENTPEHYRIPWPQGTDIVDLRQVPPARIKIPHDGEKTPD